MILGFLSKDEGGIVPNTSDIFPLVEKNIYEDNNYLVRQDVETNELVYYNKNQGSKDEYIKVSKKNVPQEIKDNALAELI